MKLTNRLCLPASIVSAVTNDPYSAGNSDISVTKLITPPYQRQLLRRLGDDLVEDVSDRIYSLMGQIGHSIVERMTIDPVTSIAEQRLFREVEGKIVSGQFDYIESGTLTDFKFTSVYAISGKAEWEQQLNLLRVLCWNHYNDTGDERYIINKIQIVAVFRDWMKAKIGTRPDYPATQVAVIPVQLWPIHTASEFMKERVRLHFADDPQPCTNEERWATEPVFALMKKGRKTAVKLYANEAAADAAAGLKGRNDHMVVHRPIEYKRCASYCSAASICPVWQEHMALAPF